MLLCFGGSLPVAGALRPLPLDLSRAPTGHWAAEATARAGVGVAGDVRWGRGQEGRPALFSAQGSQCTVRARPLNRESSSGGCSRSEGRGPGL